MSAKHRVRAILPGLLLGACSLVLAADEEIPEIDFIEYLGMWEESDDVWLALDDSDEHVAADSDERIDPVPERTESMETDDES